MGFPGGTSDKEPTCNLGDLASIPGLGRFPGEGRGYPLQCSGLENSMDCILKIDILFPIVLTLILFSVKSYQTGYI